MRFVMHQNIKNLGMVLKIYMHFNMLWKCYMFVNFVGGQ